jgi:hypothetical protein
MQQGLEGWTKVEQNYFSFDKPCELVGVLKEFRKGNFGDNAVLLVDGKETMIGNYTALTQKLKAVAPGRTVMIQYKGEVKGESGRMYKDFDVLYKNI